MYRYEVPLCSSKPGQGKAIKAISEIIETYADQHPVFASYRAIVIRK